MTLIQRRLNVASTFSRRCINVVCPLGPYPSSYIRPQDRRARTPCGKTILAIIRRSGVYKIWCVGVFGKYSNRTWRWKRYEISPCFFSSFEKPILVIALDKASFLPKNVDIFLFVHESICCWYSLEAPRWGASNEYPQHIFSRTNNKIYFLIPPLIWSYVGNTVLLSSFLLLLAGC